MPAPQRQTSLADPGTLLSTTHRAGELRVRLRLSRPSDALPARAFLEGLSAETRQRRFLAAMPQISGAVVRHFTFFDPRKRLVVAATAPIDGQETIVGLADVALLETGLAELGVVVGDDHQAQGVGKLLTEVVASLAVQQGATHLKAELLENNLAMRAILESLGRTVRTVEDGMSVAYTKLAASSRRRAA
jgi:RimJ/RimL family protein N-acetyltransferase